MVKAEAVVQQRRRLEEHLASHLEIDLAPALAAAFDESQGRPELWQGEVANSYTG
jgi:hypothetical protein